MRFHARWIRIWALPGMLLLSTAVVWHCSFAEEPASNKVSTWVDGLTRSGHLKVEYYDPARPPKPYPGWTQFEFSLDYRYEYRMDWTPRKAGGVAVVVTPDFQQLDLPVLHRVQLPMTLKSNRWFETGLGRHELDHVRVGMHPRLAMLGKHLMSKVRRLDGIVNQPDDVTQAWVQKRVDAEMAPRRDAIQALVLAINSKLDTLTNHGATELPEREEFLSKLYLKENLDEMKFPYLPQALDLISKPEYQRVRIQLQQVDPPSNK